jgi:hypothetical protein
MAARVPVDHRRYDFMVALQSNSLTRDDIVALCPESQDIIKDHRISKASKLVAQHFRLIHGSLSGKEHLQQLRMSHVGKLRTADLPAGVLLIVYDVKSSGRM